MKLKSYFYNCSIDYINSIKPNLYQNIAQKISLLPKRSIQAEINRDLWWLFINDEWNYDKKLKSVDQGHSIPGLILNKDVNLNIEKNDYNTCLTSVTLPIGWKTDFAKRFGNDLVQVEAQFGKVELMFKDFLGFKLAYY